MTDKIVCAPIRNYMSLQKRRYMDMKLRVVCIQIVPEFGTPAL